MRHLPSFFPNHLFLQYSIEANHFGPLERKAWGAARENMVWGWYKGEGPSVGPWDSTKEYLAHPKGPPLNGQNGENDHYHCFLYKSLKIPVRNQIFGLSGLSGNKKRGQGQRCHGSAHERHQDAQNWAALWAPPIILKSKGK